jgi:hypothetical protein
MKGRVFLLLPIMGCFNPPTDQCPMHCWGFTQEVQGVDGRFPQNDPQSMNPYGECRDRDSEDLLMPWLPIPAEFHGRACLSTQSEHAAVKAVVQAVDCGTAMQCWQHVVVPDDIDVYNAFVGAAGDGGIALAARDACLQWLYIQGCEIDDEEPGGALAHALCNDFVRDPAAAAMGDTTGCAGWRPPREEQGAYKPSYPYDCDFHPDLATSGNEDGPVCDGGDEADEGVDEESGAPLLDDPFGDLEALVECSGSTTKTCVIEPELLANITENFQTFYDEEVWLQMVNITGPGRGAQITGVDSGEDVEALLDAFGIEDEDLITHVNNIHLEGEQDALQAIYEIPLTTAWNVTVRRWNGTSWDTLSYAISVAN